MTEINVTHDGWAICHDGINIIHIVLLKAGNKLVTGQPYVEQFDTLEDAKARINELANDENYFDENFPAGAY